MPLVTKGERGAVSHAGETPGFVVGGAQRTGLSPSALGSSPRQLRRERGIWPRAVGLLAPLLAAAVIMVLFVPLTPAYDIDVFLRAGRDLVHGAPVYPTVGTSAVYSGFAFVYPYFAALPFALLAPLSFSVASVLFFLLSTACVMAASMLHSERGQLNALLVLCMAFTITGLQLGSLSPLLFAGVVLLWHVRGRPAAFLLAAPVIAAKLFLAPLLIWLLLAKRVRALAWATGATVALLVAGFLFGPMAPGEYANMLSKLAAHEAGSGFGLIGAMMDAGLALMAAQAAAAAITLGVLAAAFLRYRRTGDERFLFCAGIAASLLLTPVLWSHYLVLLAACLLVFDVRPRWMAALVLASWALSPPHGVPNSGSIQLCALTALLCYGLLLSPSAARLRGLLGTWGEGRRARAEGLYDSVARRCWSG